MRFSEAEETKLPSYEDYLTGEEILQQKKNQVILILPEVILQRAWNEEASSKCSQNLLGQTLQ